MKIGAKLRYVRLRQGLTIQEVADRAGLSKGYLSQLETDKSSPSLDTLERIAKSLLVPPAYLLPDGTMPMRVVRQNERMEYRFGKYDLRVHLLSPSPEDTLRLELVEIPPLMASWDEPHSHDGEECHYVLEGRVRAEQGEEVHVLEAGDAFYWDGRVPHRVTNVGNGTARLIIALNAPAHLDRLLRQSRAEAENNRI